VHSMETCVFYFYIPNWGGTIIIPEMLLIITGFVYVCLPVVATHATSSVSDMWNFIEQLQIAQIFGVFTILNVFFQFLWLFTSKTKLSFGIFRTEFSTLITILLYLYSLIILQISFCSAFHLLYPSSNTHYVDFPSSFVHIVTNTVWGYQMENYDNVLASPGPVFGVILELLYLLVLIVILLDFITDILTQPFNQNHKTINWDGMRYILHYRACMWPAPLNLVEIVVSIGLLAYYGYFVKKEFLAELSDNEKKKCKGVLCRGVGKLFPKGIRRRI